MVIRWRQDKQVMLQLRKEIETIKKEFANFAFVPVLVRQGWESLAQSSFKKSLKRDNL
jgi:hypothetical protein